MIDYKVGVSRKSLNPYASYALTIIEGIFDAHNYPLVVTSTYDGKHKQGSLHYLGLAFDIRIRHLSGEIITMLYNSIEQKLKSIDDRYQVIKQDTHIHVEFDRRLIQ